MSVVAFAVVLAGAAAAAKVKSATVDCSKGQSVQEMVDKAIGPATVFVVGTCMEDVNLTEDDITLSGNAVGAACNKADPSVSASGIIDGTVIIDGVRGAVEFLRITGSGAGVHVTNRANARLTCNDISDNAESGVIVERSSNATLRDNTVSGNGTRETNPFIYFDVGLQVISASSVQSDGNTYADNQYAAIEADRQSEFHNGSFLPRTPGNPADPNDRDTFVERGCNPGTGAGCFTTDEGPLAIEVFQGGLVDLRNAAVFGEMEVLALSTFRTDGNSTLLGNIKAQANSGVMIRNRSQFGDRIVTFEGTLTCLDNSLTFFSSVQCGQTCSGAIPGTCAP